ncbi:hypothetical protein HGM15179_009245, partial [Zosterops borbonicus]
ITSFFWSCHFASSSSWFVTEKLRIFPLIAFLFGSLQRLETPKAPPAWMTLSAAESSGGKSGRKCAWRQR